MEEKNLNVVISLSLSINKIVFFFSYLFCFSFCTTFFPFLFCFVLFNGYLYQKPIFPRLLRRSKVKEKKRETKIDSIQQKSFCLLFAAPLFDVVIFALTGNSKSDMMKNVFLLAAISQHFLLEVNLGFICQ